MLAGRVRSDINSNEYGITEHISPTTMTSPAIGHCNAASTSIDNAAAGAVNRHPITVASANASRLGKRRPGVRGRQDVTSPADGCARR